MKTLLYISMLTLLLTSCTKKPEANFTLSKTFFHIGDTILFNNKSLNASKYEWSFGDGVTSTDESPSHAFASSDTFLVSLKAYDISGENISEIAYKIYVEGEKMQYSFTFDGVKYSKTVEQNDPFTFESKQDLSYFLPYGFAAYKTSFYNDKEFSITTFMTDDSEDGFRNFFKTESYAYTTPSSLVSNSIKIVFTDKNNYQWTSAGIIQDANQKFTITSIKTTTYQAFVMQEIRAVFNCQFRDANGNLKTLKDGYFHGFMFNGK